jgi:hypothetical protein
MNNNFRAISLSEGFIFEKNDNLLRKFSKNDLTDIYIKIDEDDENYSPCSKLLSPLTPKNSNFNVSSSENFFEQNTSPTSPTYPMYIENISPNKYLKLEDIELKIEKNIETHNKLQIIIISIKKLLPSTKFLKYSLKKLIMFMFHLSLISIFEIIFFFSIVSTYENKAITEVIINFFNKVPSVCNSLSLPQKENFTEIFNSIVNITDINYNSFISSNKRKIFNHGLFVNAWMYFLIIIGIDLILLLIKCYCKIKINFKKIILENLVMISILALYEYMFFKSIILLYDNISKNELIKLMAGQFNTCLI